MSRTKSDEVSFQKLVEFLRARHPRQTAEGVEADAGIAAATVRSWLVGASRPGFSALVRLIGAYGPDLLAPMFPRAQWLDAAHRRERLRLLRDELASLEAPMEGTHARVETGRLGGAGDPGAIDRGAAGVDGQAGGSPGGELGEAGGVNRGDGGEL
jgi:hypothetical protein